MSLTSPPPRATREYRIGDRVEPAPKPKLDVRPMSFVDSPQRGPKGIFRNGSRT